ncbi:MAG: DNA alkylation repair protein [Lutibacter sp.]
MTSFINTLEIEFAQHANPKIALEQKAYMRNQFAYFGIKAKERREIQKPFLAKELLPKKDDLENISKSLWEKPQRDYQYFSQELAFNYVKQLEKKDIELFEYMVTHKSWWDTVDFIAVNLIGEYFKKFPQQREALRLIS